MSLKGKFRRKSRIYLPNKIYLGFCINVSYSLKKICLYNLIVFLYWNKIFNLHGVVCPI